MVILGPGHRAQFAGHREHGNNEFIIDYFNEKR
jgi:hypothetical protein